jgi:hypothetical protein
MSGQKTQDRTNRVGRPGQTGYARPDTVVRQKSESKSEENSEVDIDSLELDLGGEDSGRRPSQKIGDEIDDSFEEWWKQVPRKVAKPAAAKMFRRIVEKGDATVDELIAGIVRYAGEVVNREQRYIAHPCTWLSQGRWADEPARPVGNGPPVQHSAGGNNHIAIAIEMSRQAQERKRRDGADRHG